MRNTVSNTEGRRQEMTGGKYGGRYWRELKAYRITLVIVAVMVGAGLFLSAFNPVVGSLIGLVFTVVFMCLIPWALSLGARRPD